MSLHASRPLSLVIYAKNGEALAHFYARVLGLETVERADGHLLLDSAQIEIAIVQAPPAIAARIALRSPAEPRSETPIKPSFGVDAIEALRAPIHELGGHLKPASAAWSWRGALHLDGWDPEGNVFQLRERRD